MRKRTILPCAAFTLFLLVPLAGAQSTHAFLWTQAGGMQDLGALPNWQDSGALAISKSGQVVGSLVNPANGDRAGFAWSAKKGMHVLKGLSTKQSVAFGINTSLQIVGGAYTTGTIEHAFLWTPTGGM